MQRKYQHYLPSWTPIALETLEVPLPLLQNNKNNQTPPQ